MELSELLQRCREGDALAWEALVRQYQSRVFGIAYTYVGNREEARDLAQDVFVRVYERLAACRDAERFPAWLARIARNASLDHLRRRGARPPLQDVPAETVRGLSDPGPTPEDLWLADGQKRLVHRALQRLSAISREIILLRDMQELPQAEVAAILGIPVGTVKSRSNRARIELAQAVRALGGPRAAEGGGA
jgi:RNA polymerase sigma-70 factor (ECF subfamily)